MILVFSGTKDGRELIKYILKQGFKVIASTVSKYGSDLIENHPKLKKIYGELQEQQIISLVKRMSINVIVDATHPYATQISQNLLQVTKIMGTRLIRFERPSCVTDNVIGFNSYKEIVNYLNVNSGNVLLTIGANNLSCFSNVNNNQKRLVARILPAIKSLEKALDAGIKPANIIAMQGPFSFEFNETVIRDFNIKYLVTKDSGDTGGIKEKIKAAKVNDVEVLMLIRPKMQFDNIAQTKDKVIDFISKQN